MTAAARGRTVGAAFLLLAFAGGGCGTGVRDRFPDLPERERLEQIEGLRIEDFARNDPTPHATSMPSDDVHRLQRARAIKARAPARDFAQVSLAEARVSALSHGLNLRVAVADPEIADAAADVERARFDAVFAVQAGRRTTAAGPEPETTQLFEREVWSVEPLVRVPLRTGGTMSVGLPMSTDVAVPQSTGLRPNRSSVDFSISQPLLRGAGTGYATTRILVSDLTAMRASASTRLTATRVVANVEKAYWRLYGADRTLHVLIDDYDRAIQQVELASRLAQEGVRSEVEVKRARAGIGPRLEAVIVAETQRRLAERELKRQMRDPEFPITTDAVLVPSTDPVPVPITADRARLLDLGLSNRMDVLDADLALAIDDVTADARRSETLPALNLDFSYSFSGLQPTTHRLLRNQFRHELNSGSVGLTFEMPLGNAAAESRLRQVLLTRTRDEGFRALVIEGMSQEIADAADAVELNWQRILVARQAAIFAGENYEAQATQFRSGVATSTDVLDAASLISDAQTQEIAALAAYQTSLVDIAMATGTVLGQGSIRWGSAP